MARHERGASTDRRKSQSSAAQTPVMLQHRAAKEQHPDCIVFFRLGDFYEMFGEDAVLAAKELGLTLTSRNKGKPDEIPMAGVPHHAAQGYIARLLARGHKVAICEQMADPSTVRGIVPREVVRVITPGTWTEAEALGERENSWLGSIVLAPAPERGIGFALLDLTTAELIAAELADPVELLAEIGRAMPRELLVSGEGTEDRERLDALILAVGEVARGLPLRRLETGPRETEPSESRASVLSGIDVAGVSALGQAAAGQALAYARACYKDRELPVWRVSGSIPGATLGIDRAAVTHLELVQASSDDAGACLLAVVDRTRSPGGARLFRRRLLSPLVEVAAIRRRQDQVEALVEAGGLRKEIGRALGEVGDLERLAVRASLGESSPRDLGLLRRGLTAAAEVVELTRKLGAARSMTLGLGEKVDVAPELRQHLTRALVERPPAQAKETAIFLPSYDAELNELAALCTDGAARMATLESTLRERTGISTLRVRFTRVFGWYVEVGRSQQSKVPSEWRRKQTVAGGERYTLPELGDLAEEILSAEDRYRAREQELLGALLAEVVPAAPRVHALSGLLSALDVALALAEVATLHGYVRPLVDASEILEITDGRHPVVERRAGLGQFVPNDVSLEVGREHLWIVSGPNMAGKSTFLRQVALIVILAQMGSYVPAQQARIGVVDRILSRVGASDNLAGGESTFMVEMRETAAILRSATRRSLVILDEVGRGTSTYDGLSIAWAVAEHLDAAVKCRTLFATHYHELTELAAATPTTANVHVSAREHEGQVVFLHRVVRGAASRSYGVEVARLAGLPELVLSRARGLLAAFEGGAPARVMATPSSEAQLHLFRAVEAHPAAEEILTTLRGLDLDRLTGLEALQLLARLRGLL